MKKQTLSTIISFVLALFLSFAVFTVVICSVFLCTLANPNVIDKTISQSDYAKPLKEEISAKWDNLAAICGMDERDVLLSLLTEERIENDSRKYFKMAYEGKTLDTSNLKKEVYDIVSDYAHSHDLNLISAQELEQNINDLVTSCMEEYDRSVKIRLMTRAFGTIGKIRPTVLIALVISFLISAGIIVFIFYLQTDRKKTLFYLFSAFAANAVLYLFAVLFTYLNNLINRIPIEESALYNLTVKYLNDTFTFITVTAVLLCIVSALVLAFYIKPSKNKEKDVIN